MEGKKQPLFCVDKNNPALIKRIEHQKDCFFKNITFGKEFITDLRDWTKYNFDNDYSTHDFISDLALEINLKMDDYLINQGLEPLWKINHNFFWNERRRKIYLYATAGPDYCDPFNNPFINFKAITDNRQYYLREENNKFRRTWHQVRLDANGNIIRRIQWIDIKERKFYTGHFTMEQEYNCIDRAYFWQRLAKSFIRSRHYDITSFCLGIMTHYMGDAACFLHLLDPYEIDDINNLAANEVMKILDNFLKIHNSYEAEISLRFNSSDRDGLYTENNEDRFKFFSINIKDMIKELISEDLDAYQATYRIAYETFLSPPTALWMLKNYERVIGRHWSEDLVGWQKNPYWINLNNGDTYSFLSKVEKTLNFAVLNIAHALKNTILNNRI